MAGRRGAVFLGCPAPRPSVHLCLCTSSRVNCSFYFKIGACRHGDRCSRLHNKPTFSQVRPGTEPGGLTSCPFPFCCPPSRGPAFSGFLGPTLPPGVFLVGALQVPLPTFRPFSQELGHAPVRKDHTPGLSLTARYPLFWFSEAQALLLHSRCLCFFSGARSHTQPSYPIPLHIVPPSELRPRPL